MGNTGQKSGDKNIKPPEEIEETMTKQMRAERERRQTVTDAQAHQEAVVERAEDDKRTKILAAESLVIGGSTPIDEVPKPLKPPVPEPC